jgi:hypothetical protein
MNYLHVLVICQVHFVKNKLNSHAWTAGSAHSVKELLFGERACGRIGAARPINPFSVSFPFALSIFTKTLKVAQQFEEVDSEE